MARGNEPAAEAEVLAGEAGGVKRFEGGIAARRLLDFFPKSYPEVGKGLPLLN